MHVIVYNHLINHVMKTKTLILSIFTFIFFTGLKSQTLPVNGHFVNSNKEQIKADYVLSCEGKVLDSGSSLENLNLDLTVNKVYLLKVSKDGFKTKTICFSIHPETGNGKYVFEFDVCLKENNSSLTLTKQMNKVLESTIN